MHRWCSLHRHIRFYFILKLSRQHSDAHCHGEETEHQHLFHVLFLRVVHHVPFVCNSFCRSFAVGFHIDKDDSGGVVQLRQQTRKNHQHKIQTWPSRLHRHIRFYFILKLSRQHSDAHWNVIQILWVFDVLGWCDKCKVRDDDASLRNPTDVTRTIITNQEKSSA